MDCKTPGCEEPAKTKDLCGAHYQTERKARIRAEGRVCREDGCDEPPTRYGRCAPHYEQRRASKTPEQRQAAKERHVEREYGIPLEEYEERLRLPCEVCGRDDGSRVLDHDHHGGGVRGTLCRRCNTGLSYFFEDLSLLETAASYLENR
jgi:hypothetical protein